MVQRIECLRHAFQFHFLRQRKRAAKPCVQAEEVETDAGIASNDATGKGFGAWVQASVVREVIARCAGPLGCALLGIGAGGDVVRQTRVVLKDATQSPAMRKVPCQIVNWRGRRIQARVEDHPMSLVIVRPAAIDAGGEVVMGELKKNSPTSSIAFDQV